MSPSPFVLAASAETLFTDLPVAERLQRIGERGLQAEIWNWANHDLPALAQVGVPITSMTGYLRGELVDPEGAKLLLETARESAEAAAIIDCPRLNLHGTGLDGRGLPVRPVELVTGADWLAAAKTLEAVASIGAEYGRVYTLENLNLPVDHPGTPFALAKDTLALVRAIDHPHLKLNLDLYHAQIGEGNLIELCAEALPWVGEIQVADVPGRCEPGTGEINYRAVARALSQLGYQGPLGLEAFASETSELALDRFVATFSDLPDA